MNKTFSSKTKLINWQNFMRRSVVLICLVKVKDSKACERIWQWIRRKLKNWLRHFFFSVIEMDCSIWFDWFISTHGIGSPFVLDVKCLKSKLWRSLSKLKLIKQNINVKRSIGQSCFSSIERDLFEKMEHSEISIFETCLQNFARIKS